MKFQVEFGKLHSQERHMISVMLSARDLAAAGDDDLRREAFVLRHAYRLAPSGFLHVPGTIRNVFVQ